ncbi:MAG: hypothetical protein P4L28_11880 [Paludibacteraceae bacterium]|nr:hypothetical protein [Paludibacteraceae bacterium]
MDYTTTHDPVAQTMTHHFQNGYTITVHWKLKKAIKCFDDKIDTVSIEGLSIQDYHNMLLKISKEK